MKIFSAIFAIYFSMLSIIPCIDSEIVKDNCQAQTSCIHLNTEHPEHQSDLCSPLCMCSCCGGITIILNSENNLIAQIPTEQLSIYNQNSPSEISFFIWQPPKIS